MAPAAWSLLAPAVLGVAEAELEVPAALEAIDEATDEAEFAIEEAIDVAELANEDPADDADEANDEANEAAEDATEATEDVAGALVVAATALELSDELDATTDAADEEAGDAASRTQISVVMVPTFKVSSEEHAFAIHGVATLVMAFLALPHWHA